MSDTLRFYLSGGRGNTDPAKSLGGPMSQTEVTSVFDNVDPDQAATGGVDLRCVYMLVAEGGPVEYPRVWFAETPERTALEVGIDIAGKNGTAQQLAPGQEPIGVSFYRPDDYLTGIALPGEPYKEGDRVPLWLRRLTPSNAQPGREAFSLRVRGLTLGEP